MTAVQHQTPVVTSDPGNLARIAEAPASDDFP